MRFGIEFVPDTAFWQTVGHGILSEKYGFDFIWITDHFNNRNVYVILSLIANYTDRVYLGPGVTNPYLTHPAFIASSIASLDRVSGGRAVVGLGAGDRVTLGYLGVERKKPLRAIRECVEILRAFFRGERVSYQGEIFNVQSASISYKPLRKIPIYIGAQGPKMLALAAEIGDGILINASHPIDFRFAMEHIKKGLERAGKRKEDIDIAAYTSFSVDENPEKARKAAIPVVAFITAGSPKIVLERHDIPEEAAESIREALKAGKFKEAFSQVTDDMIEAFTIYGTPEDCVKKVEELVDIGITQLVVGSPIGKRKRKAMKLIGEHVIPKLKEEFRG